MQEENLVDQEQAMRAEARAKKRRGEQSEEKL